MAKTKLDRVLEILESQVSNSFGNEGMANTSEPTAQFPATNENTTSDVEAVVSNVTTNTEGTTVDAVEESLNVDELPQENNTADVIPGQVESDTFDKEFAELAALVWYNADAQAPAKSEQVAEQPSPVEEPISKEENDNYKKLYEKELERRVALEGDNRNVNAEVKYLRTMLEKEGDKYYWTIDKQKELEAELRVANAARMPDQIAPLWQSYLLWEETKTPTHKWRAIRDALNLVEGMTWVSAEEYYATILRTENKDIPEVKDKSSFTSTAQNINGQGKIPWFAL